MIPALRPAVRLGRRLHELQPIADAWLTGWRVLGAMDLGESAPGMPTLGSCYYDTRSLVLVERVLALPRRRVEQLLRHELAHAVVGPYHGHNQVWREIAELVGYDDAWTFVPPLHELEPRLMVMDEHYLTQVAKLAAARSATRSSAS